MFDIFISRLFNVTTISILKSSKYDKPYSNTTPTKDVIFFIFPFFSTSLTCKSISLRDLSSIYSFNLSIVLFDPNGLQ